MGGAQTGAQRRKKYFLSFSTTKDTQDLLDYYSANAHGNVYQREESQIRERIRSGAVIMLRDEQDKIVAASITWPIMDKQGRHKWSEVGTTRFTLPGFGLYEPMVASQIVQSALVEPPEDRFIAEVDVSNTAVIYLLHKKLGWPTYNPPKDLEEAVEGTVDPNEPITPVNWYQCGPETLAKHAGMVMKLIDNPVLKNSKTGEEIEIDMSKFPLAQKFKKAVEVLSKMQAANDDRPDPKKTVAKLHRKLMPPGR